MRAPGWAPWGRVPKDRLGFVRCCGSLRGFFAPVAQLDRASDFEGDETAVGSSPVRSATRDPAIDDAKPAEGTPPLLFAATFQVPIGAPLKGRSWLAALAELGPGLVNAAVALPAGAIGSLTAAAVRP
jgi:hypothetical protein